MDKCEKCLFYKSKEKCGECGRLSNVMDNKPMFTPNTNYNCIKSMSVEEMAEFIVKIKLIFGEDIYNHIQEQIKDYVVKIDYKKIPKWEKKECEFYEQWLLQEVSENDTTRKES